MWSYLSVEGTKSMYEYRHYFDIQKTYEKPAISEDLVVASSHELSDVLKQWNDYISNHTIRRYKYTERKHGKKYEPRFGYRLEILVPKNFKKCDASIVANVFMDDLLKGFKKVSWIAEYVQYGEGYYLVINMILAKKYKKLIIDTVLYAHDGYRNKHTGGFISKDHPDAVLTYQKGDVKESIETSWSQKIRLFEGSISEFKENIIPMFQSLILKALNSVKKVREKKYLKSIKHKVLKNKLKSHYYNSNIRYYNSFVTEANILLERWETAIYSPAGYYQDSEVVGDWIAFKNRYQTFLENKKFKYKTLSKELKLSINPWINTVRFRENIVTLHEMFLNHLELFLNKHIFS